MSYSQTSKESEKGSDLSSESGTQRTMSDLTRHIIISRKAHNALVKLRQILSVAHGKKYSNDDTLIQVLEIWDASRPMEMESIFKH